MKYPIRYELLSLEFRSPGIRRVHTIGFKNRPMAFRSPNRVSVPRPGTPVTEIKRLLGLVGNLDLSAINYEIQVGHGLPPLRMRHDFKVKDKVRLTGPRVQLVSAAGRPLFKFGYTLREVSQGAIPSSQHVYQFVD